MPKPEESSQRAEILKKIQALEDKAMVDQTNLTERMEAWEKSLEQPAVHWTGLDAAAWENFGTKFE